MTAALVRCMPAKDPFQSIDPSALENVSGGTATAAGASTTTTTTGTGTTDPVLQLLTEVATELQTLVQQQQSGPGQMMQQMMQMMMMNAFAPRPTSGKGS